MGKKRLQFLLFCFLSLLFLHSCGLEAYYYIDYIPAPINNDYSRSIIRLPSSDRAGYGGDGDYFDNFVIYYRIYISSIDPIVDIEQRNSINTSLNSNYNTFLSYTDITSTSANTSRLEDTFLNTRFYKLVLEGANADSVLGDNSLDRLLVINFEDNAGVVPRLQLYQNSVLDENLLSEYRLLRANSKYGTSTDFYPLPEDRYFFNDEELYNNSNATDTINADTASNTTSAQAYTCVAMYIMAKGKSLEALPTDIYSQPAFIGVLKLPNSY